MMKMNKIIKYGLSVLALAGLTTSAQAYTINVAEAQNCMVSISPEKSSYDEGEEITVTIMPNAYCTFDSFELYYECSEAEWWEVQSSMVKEQRLMGPRRRVSSLSYRLESFYFNDSYDDEYEEVTEGEEYTFIMPARNVEVEAIFTSSNIAFEVAVVQTANGTTSVNKTTAEAGDNVTITATGSEGYMASEVRVYERESIGWAIYETLLDNVTKESVTQYSFTMPSNPVKILVTYSQNILGDINWDGSVSIADLTALVNIILEKDTAGVYNHVAADVNTDNDITITDVTALVNIILVK